MRKFLKSAGIWLAKTVTIFVLLTIGGSLMLYYSTSRPAKIADNSTLYVDMDRPLVESPSIPNTPFFRLLTGQRAPELTAMLVADALRAAARDGRIARVVLNLDEYHPTGSETVADVARAIEAVKAAGKPVFAYANNLDRSAYRLAAVATKAYVSPLGQVDLSGPEAGQLYFGDLLKKFGIDIHIAKAGRYKSAVEPFELGAISKDARTSLEGLLNGHREQFVATAAAARRMTPAAFNASANALPDQARAGSDIAEAATSLGLIDGTATQLEMDNQIAGLPLGAAATRKFNPAVVKLDDYMRSVDPETCPVPKRENGHGGMVAIVPMIGEITMNEKTPGTISPGSTVALLRHIRESDRTAAVVLRIDSPGGDVQASEIIRREILALRQSGVPVVASLSNTAASGGYWVASAANEIVAGQFTTTGSIGVFAIVPSVNRLAVQHQVNPQVVRAGPEPLGPSLVEAPTTNQIALLDANVAGLYRRFVGLVATSRHMAPEAVNAIAQGRVWTGPQAVGLRLADRVGTLDTAVARAAALGQTSPKCKALLPRTVGFQEAFSLLSGQQGPKLPGSEAIASAAALLTQRPGRAMAFCAECAAVR